MTRKLQSIANSTFSNISGTVTAHWCHDEKPIFGRLWKC